MAETVTVQEEFRNQGLVDPRLRGAAVLGVLLLDVEASRRLEARMGVGLR